MNNFFKISKNSMFQQYLNFSKNFSQLRLFEVTLASKQGFSSSPWASRGIHRASRVSLGLLEVSPGFSRYPQASRVSLGLLEVSPGFSSFPWASRSISWFLEVSLGLLEVSPGFLSFPMSLEMFPSFSSSPWTSPVSLILFPFL